MVNGKIWRRTAFIVASAAFLCLAAFWLSKEKISCLGVPILPESAIADSIICEKKDLQDEILFMNEPAAIDAQTDTIYIAQNLDESTLYTELEGLLTVKDDKYPLYFVKDTAFDAFAESAGEGHKFTLLVDTLDGRYMRYNVVFTNLPVFRMDGAVKYQKEDGRDAYVGNVVIWDPCYEGSGKYSVKTSLLHWNKRGVATSYDPKNSYKLSFKNDDGTNRNMEFLGLDEGDDDWIINAMHREDAKMRDKLVQDLWNRCFADEEYHYKMSQSRYAELVLNGEYRGLYLLMRRLDEKYLDLGEGQVLVKGVNAAKDLSVEETMEVVYSGYEGDNLYAALERIKNRVEAGYIDIDNWIDINLVIDLGYMPDNTRNKNVYYILDNVDTDLRARMLLWDTDISYGINYGEYSGHRPEIATFLRNYRREEPAVLEMYPDLYKRMAERWFELREEKLTMETFREIIDANYKTISSYGAHDREIERWGIYHEEGTDDIEHLYRFIEQRLEYLDSVHRENLRG